MSLNNVLSFNQYGASAAVEKEGSFLDRADIIIIGGGVVGCAVARQLSRYELRIILLEASDDVATGASKANSGIVHGGYTAKAGSLKGDLSIRGNRMFDALEQDLHFGFRRTGSLVLSFDDRDLNTLEGLLLNGRKNGVRGLDILSAADTLARYPSINPDIKGALFCPETAIVSPYEYCIALAENAVSNGVDLRLGHRVVSITKKKELFTVRAGGTDFEAPFVINAAGAESAAVSELAGASDFKILPRKGQYLLMRRGSGTLLDTVVFQPPTDKGKGILVTPTVWGNLLIGPNAEDIDSTDDLDTDPETLAEVLETAKRSVPSLDIKQSIRFFSGIRPRGDRGDFIIEESSVEGFFNLGGIESPGLTSSPAIALKVESLLTEKGLVFKAGGTFQPHRQAINSPHPLMPVKEAAALVNKEYGDPMRLVCRCEQVSEAIIRDSLSRGIELRSLDAVKRRTRAGMGHCQGKFCGPRVKEYLMREQGLSSGDIRGHSRNPEKIRETLDKILNQEKIKD